MKVKNGGIKKCSFWRCGVLVLDSGVEIDGQTFCSEKCYRKAKYEATHNYKPHFVIPRLPYETFHKVLHRVE